MRRIKTVQSPEIVDLPPIDEAMTTRMTGDNSVFQELQRVKPTSRYRISRRHSE